MVLINNESTYQIATEGLDFNLVFIDKKLIKPIDDKSIAS